MNRLAWIIPANTAILFGVLCFWSIQKHDTVWSVIDMIFCLVNGFFAYQWLKNRPTRSRR